MGSTPRTRQKSRKNRKVSSSSTRKPSTKPSTAASGEGITYWSLLDPTQAKQLSSLISSADSLRKDLESFTAQMRSQYKTSEIVFSRAYSALTEQAYGKFWSDAHKRHWQEALSRLFDAPTLNRFARHLNTLTTTYLSSTKSGTCEPKPTTELGSSRLQESLPAQSQAITPSYAYLLRKPQTPQAAALTSTCPTLIVQRPDYREP